MVTDVNEYLKTTRCFGFRTELNVLNYCTELSTMCAFKGGVCPSPGITVFGIPPPAAGCPGQGSGEREVHVVYGVRDDNVVVDANDARDHDHSEPETCPNIFHNESIEIADKEIKISI